MEILKSFKKKTENPEEVFIYTEEQLMARLKFFIGICLALTLTGIVFVVLYSIIFVTQPLNAISPIDQKFFELIIPIATFLTGTLSGIMLASKDDKAAQLKALEAANSGWGRNPQTSSTTFTGPGGFSSSVSSTTSGGFKSTGGFSSSPLSSATSMSAVPSFGSPVQSTSGFPQFNKPPSMGPVDSDFMPPRNDD